VRQDARLDTVGRFELAGDIRRLLALRLHDALERAPLPCRFGEREHEQHAEEHQQAHGRRRGVEQPVPRAECEVRDQRGQRHARDRQQRRIARLPARRRVDQQSAQQQEHRKLGERAPVRSREQRLVEQVLEELRMDFASRHPLAQRRELVVDQTLSRHADQHQLLREPLGIDVALQHVDRRNETARIAVRVIDAHGAVALGRRGEIAECDRAHGAAIDGDPMRGLADRHAQHFDRQRGCERAVDVEHQRNAADHRFVVSDRDHPMSGSGLIEHVDAARHAGKPGDRKALPSACAARYRHRRHAHGSAGGGRRAGERHHRGRGGERARKRGVVRRQLREAFGENRILRARVGQQAFRRQPIRFRHQDVDADRRGLVARDRVDQSRERRARPRPLPKLGEALFVDRHHGGGHRLDYPRRSDLQPVEPRRLKAVAHRRFEPEEDREHA
jgi:hypothetical protein